MASSPIIFSPLANSGLWAEGGTFLWPITNLQQLTRLLLRIHQQAGTPNRSNNHRQQASNNSSMDRLMPPRGPAILACPAAGADLRNSAGREMGEKSKDAGLTNPKKRSQRSNQKHSLNKRSFRPVNATILSQKLPPHLIITAALVLHMIQKALRQSSRASHLLPWNPCLFISAASRTNSIFSSPSRPRFRSRKKRTASISWSSNSVAEANPATFSCPAGTRFFWKIFTDSTS